MSDGRGRQRRDGDVDEYVTAMLTASRVLVGISARSITEVQDAVTIAQFRTLVVLSRGATSLSGLSVDLGVNASTAMRMIDRLLGAALVTRTENPHDRRGVVLGLSPSGRRLVDRVTARRRVEIAEIVDAMPAGRRSELIAALRAFNRAAGEPVVPDGDAAW